MTYDQFIAALAIWREMRGESRDAQIACWWVVLNRVRDVAKRWPRTIPGVILQKWQFSSFNLGEPNSVKFPLDDGGADWQAWLQIRDIVSNSVDPDPTGGANMYEACAPGKQPSWVESATLTLTLGNTRFYRL